MASNYSVNGAKTEILVMYKECLHNHAAHAMGNFLDGCGLFEPSGPNGTTEAMVCAACHCHRNFHRRIEVELPLCCNSQAENSQFSQEHATMVIPAPLPQPQVHQQTSTSPARSMFIPDPLPHPQVHQQTSSGRAPTSAPRPAIARQEMNQPQDAQNSTSLLPGPPFQLSEVPVQEGSGPQMGETQGTMRKKRITREQSERLRVLAERNNWKMFCEYSKEEVIHICSEIGITKTVLKSWIFNHRRKQAARNVPS